VRRASLLPALRAARSQRVLSMHLLPAAPRAAAQVGEQCFVDQEQRRPGDIQQSMRTLQMASKQITTELHYIVKVTAHCWVPRLSRTLGLVRTRLLY
jgi:hypothetical protein